MKIVTWNINGIRSMIGQNPRRMFGKMVKVNDLHKYIKNEDPDIICLQETKADAEQIDENLRYPDGYKGYFHSCSRKKGYSGVVTYSKQEPIDVYNEIDIEIFDIEGRIVATEFPEFVLFNVYFPNGTSGQERVDYKLNFYDALFEHTQQLRATGKKIIICGDYNIAHHEIDLARPKQNVNNSGFLPEERVKLDEIVEMGYVDTFREFCKEPDQYSWWSNRGRARENNIGWRIDYHFVSGDLMPLVTNTYLQQDVTGSDHCPMVLELDI